MRLFGRAITNKPKTKKPYHRREPETPKEKQDKVEKKVAWSSFVKQMKDDPELEKQFVLSKMGIEVKPKDPAEQKRQELRATLIDEACKLIGEDEELRREYAETMIEEVIGETKGKGKRRGEPEYYGEPGSSISQALEDVESLSDLREKLAELGMIEGGGGGFFKGMGMKDLLAALPFIAQIMGKGEAPVAEQSLRTYLVRIDGQNQEVPELQYRKLLQEGKIQPVAVLEYPKPEAPKVPVEEVSTEIPELPDFLQGIDFTVVEGWFEQEPEDFVINLKAEVDAELEESRLAYGFLTTATYEGIVEKITPFRTHPKVGNLVERVLSEKGKQWLIRVLELVKETLNE